MTLSLALILMPAVPTTAKAQEHAAQIRQLDWFVGSWTYDQTEGGAECKKLGDFMVHCTSTWKTAEGDDAEAVFITRYDAVDETWKAYRFYRNGYADQALGWIEGGTHTYVYEGRNGARRKFVGVAEGETWAYTWYRSLQGGPWERTEEGSMTRVR
jgi:hypothetical protein